MSSLERMTPAQKRAMKKLEMEQANKPVVAPVTEQSDAEKEAADEAAYQEELKLEAAQEKADALRKQQEAQVELGKALHEKKVEPVVVKQEEVKVEIATSHPQGCEFFGTFDPTNKNCTKDCLEFCAECVEACKLYTASKNVKGVKPNKPARVKKEGGSTRGGNRVLIASSESGAGKIDLLLCRPEGCTMTEMQEHRGAVSSHLAALKAAGFNIIQEGGKYFYRKPVEATA